MTKMIFSLLFKQEKSSFVTLPFVVVVLGLKITVNPESKAVLAGQFVKLCCRATGHPFVQYQWFKMNKEVIFKCRLIPLWLFGWLVGSLEARSYAVAQTGLELTIEPRQVLNLW